MPSSAPSWYSTSSVSSVGSTSMNRRPKPARSREETRAPTATPASAARSHTRPMVDGSPAWKPQATFALVTMPSSASSSPSRQTPKPSPRSAFRSIVRDGGLLTAAVSHRGAPSGDTPVEMATCRQSVPRPGRCVCDPEAKPAGSRQIGPESTGGSGEHVPTSGVGAPALLEALPDVVVVVDAAARIVYVNPAVRNLLGREPVDLRGRPLTVLVPRELRDAYETGFGDLLANGPARPPGQPAQIGVLHADGSEVPVEIT